MSIFRRITSPTTSDDASRAAPQSGAVDLHQAQRLETVARLVGGMAHETNNQMMVVQSFIEFLMRAPNLTAEQRKDLETVGHAADRVASLTRQLVTLSQPQVLDSRVLNLDALVMEAEPVLRQPLGSEIRLTFHLEPGEKWIRVDRNQMIQVLVNLALNARDAISASGELNISTRKADHALPGGRLGASFQSGVALLSIADTGSGIEAPLLGRIFEPFFTTKPAGQATGLGLPVVEGIVAQSGGDIWVESKPGYGTVVTIGFPLAEKPVEAPSGSPVNGQRRGTERVLVVDDEDQVRRFLVRGLKLGEYDVIEASGGPEAIAILEQERGEIQLVVTDIAMPDMNGVALAERLTSDFPGLPVLFVSGHPYDAVARNRTMIDPDRFLQKPFKVDTLLMLVRNALDRSPRA